jgi:acetylxylan esterase
MVAGHAALASAAGLEQVTAFGENPSNIKMYLHVPAKLISETPPVLVGLHWCHGDAPAFYSGTGFAALADKYGFIVIYPSAASSDGCWDVHSNATLMHDGGSDSRGIVSMVRYVLQNRHGDATRVYVTGHSSGGMMTNVLVGAYPDVFRAGAAFAGVPFSCFAGPGTWNTACATGTITKTGAQWGDAVRAAYPGYVGPRPRMQLFHGTEDDTLSFVNFGEEIKEWTNVLGVSDVPSSTEASSPKAPYTRTRYRDANQVVRVEAIEEQGQPHNLEIMAAEAAHFFGLDASSDPVPLGGGGNSGSSGGASSSGAGGIGSAGGPTSGGAPGTASASGGAGSGGEDVAGGGGVVTGSAGTLAGVPPGGNFAGIPSSGSGSSNENQAGSSALGPATPNSESTGCNCETTSSSNVAGGAWALLLALGRRASRRRKTA